jgi:hypothetical protein
MSPPSGLNRKAIRVGINVNLVASCRILVGATVLIVSACSQDSTGGSEPAGVGGESQHDAHLRSLASDYLFKEVDEQGAAAIHQEIRSLSPDDAVVLHEALVELAGYSDDERAVSDALFARTAARQAAFFDATPQEAREAQAWVMNVDPSQPKPTDKAFCVWPYVDCTYAPFPDPVLTPVSCDTMTNNCTVGSLYQRVGNVIDGCEELGCDFQIRFTYTNATRIQGITAAATCVVMKNNKAARRTAPYTWALIGYGSTLSCSLPTGSIHTLFRVRS